MMSLSLNAFERAGWNVSAFLVILFQDEPEELSFRLKLLIAIVAFVLGEIVIVSLFFFLFDKLLVSKWNYSPRDAAALAFSLTAFFSLSLIVVFVFYLEMIPLFAWYATTAVLFLLWFVHFLFTYLLRRRA